MIVFITYQMFYEISNSKIDLNLIRNCGALP